MKPPSPRRVRRWERKGYFHIGWWFVIREWQNSLGVHRWVLYDMYGMDVYGNKGPHRVMACSTFHEADTEGHRRLQERMEDHTWEPVIPKENT